ncbi:uncharacterized protein LOC107216924 [Neodiprion lecontei]|uniref:Uncharacterized protein LOC107216924 n=1 Tax=Neodiprion lecontei TaxID=441921 RepID=A0A6J0B6F6_NEOLC|nr:uncharacterized protein LOC107216924 [Neodiprion lecontei]
MQFLDLHVKPRKTIGNIPQCSSQKKTLSSDEEPDMDPSAHDWDVYEFLNSNDENQYKEDSIGMIITDENGKVNLPPKKRRTVPLTNPPQEGNGKKVKKNNNEDLIETVKDTLKTVQHFLSNDQDTKSDINWNFCMMLYSQMKKLSKKNKMARRRILELMDVIESDDSDSCIFKKFE